MRKKKKKKLRFLWRLLLWGGSLIILLLAFLFISALSNLPSFDLLENRQITESTKIYDRTGEVLLFELFDEERRTVIPFENIPDLVKKATLSIEDENFYSHSAFDFKGLLRAVLVNARSGRVVQGGSTITQQLAKNAFLSPERTFTRKIKEAIISLKLEQTFSKDEILSLYLNQIPYGANAYGISSASSVYFQKPVEELTVAEIALLASLPKAPSYYSPWGSHVEDLLLRKDLVLDKLAQKGEISDSVLEEAKNQELTFVRLKNLEKAPHFTLAVKEYLDQTYGEDFVRRSGLKVTTTLDANLQELAEKAVLEGALRNEELYNGTNAALVAEDATTGQILALVGSRSYFDGDIDGNFNVAIQGLRQPGSALKPFAYLTALERGYPEQTVLFDVLTQFNATDDEEFGYQPENFDNRFRGPVNFRTALSHSINVPAVKALYLVGINNFLDTLKSFGINTLNDPRRYGLSLVLGGGEVTLQELVGAYATLAQEGVFHKQQMILKVEDQNGRLLENFQDQKLVVMQPENPRIINNILSDVETRSGLFVSSLPLTIFSGYEVAIKTGTTNDFRDAWAIGYTPSLAVGVWAGNNDNTPMEQQGSSLLAAIPILNSFLKEGISTQTPKAFETPEFKTSSKPMLNGNHVANYIDNGFNLPHVHNVLHYVAKKTPTLPSPRFPEADSQYENWEGPVLEWASRNIPGFLLGVTYNQPLSIGAKLGPSFAAQDQNSSINITQPSNGQFVSDVISVTAILKSPISISKIEVLTNNNLVDLQIGDFGLNYTYSKQLGIPNLGSQNDFVFRVTDKAGGVFEENLILYR